MAKYDGKVFNGKQPIFIKHGYSNSQRDNAYMESVRAQLEESQ